MRIQTALGMALLLLLPMTATASIQAFPSSVNFGQVEINSLARRQSVQVRNMSNEPTRLQISKSCPLGFQVWDFGCGLSLPAYGTCSLDIEFRPTREGYHSCTIWIRSDSNFSTETVQLSGTGVDRQTQIEGELEAD